MRRTVLTLLFCGALAADEGWVTHSVALAPDLKTVVRGRMHAERGTAWLRIEDAATLKLRREIPVQGPIRAFAFRGDGKRFVASNDHGPMRIYDTATGNALLQLPGHRSWVNDVAFAGNRVASTGRDDTLRVWDAVKGKQLWIKPKMRVGALALSPDGKRLATTDQFGKVQIWNASTGKPERRLDTGDKRWSFAIAFSPDGKRLAAGAGQVRVFDVASGKVVATIKVHRKRVRALAFSRDGTRLASADGDKVVRVWKVAGGKAEHTWKTPQAVGSLVFSPKGDTLGGASYYGKCHFWNLKTGREKNK